MSRQPNLANDAWEALLTAHAAVMKQFAAEDTWTDVSMREYDVLYTLSKCPEPVRLSELNRHVLLSQPALSRLVERLAERGLVERRHARSVTRAMTAGLTRAEMAQLEMICRKLACASDKSEVVLI